MSARLGRRVLRPAAGLAAAVLAFLLLVPVVHFPDPLSTVVLDGRGRVLSASIAADGQWRFAPPAHVPERFGRCAVLFEDRRFHWHPGVDPLAVLRALVQNLRAGRVVSGGSTLTMQVVRLARKGRPRTVGEKLVEAVLAASKERILALWAGNAPFGGNVVGLEAASWRYFGRGPEHLSWAEAATLAVLPNAPSLIHPGRNRRRLLARRNALLARLRAAGDLDGESYRLALAEPLPPRPLPLPSLAPHLLQRIRRDGHGGERVLTSLSRELQQRATAVVRRHAARLAGNGVYNVACLIAEVDTGRVLAYVGNSGGPTVPAHGGWVDLVTAPRSTGSILKPFLYAEMLEAGEILPTELVPDIPTRIGGFAPENYDHRYSGAVPAAEALARSLNVPAVRMLRDHGVDRFWGELRALGMTTLHRPAAGYGLTLILGGAETTLWDITSMYAGLARTVDAFFEDPPGGRTFRPLGYGAAGRAPESPGPAGVRLPGPAACYETLRALVEVARPGVDAAWRRFASSRKIAWKTGTSWGHRDAWAVGVTPRHVVGVWVGNASGEGRPGLTGHASAAPVLFELFGLLPADGWFDAPEARMTTLTVCTASGFRAGPDCAGRRRIEVPLACRAVGVCPWCRLVHLDASGRWRVHGGCEPVSAIRTVSRLVLPAAMEWYYRRRHPDLPPLPPVRPDCRSGPLGGGAPALACIRPAPGSTVWVPVELDGSTGRAVFQLTDRRPGARIFWHLDGDYLGETRGDHRMGLAPSPGPHLLTLVDDDGETLRVPFRVAAHERPPRGLRAGPGVAGR